MPKHKKKIGARTNFSFLLMENRKRKKVINKGGEISHIHGRKKKLPTLSSKVSCNMIRRLKANGS